MYAYSVGGLVRCMLISYTVSLYTQTLVCESLNTHRIWIWTLTIILEPSATFIYIVFLSIQIYVIPEYKCIYTYICMRHEYVYIYMYTYIFLYNAINMYIFLIYIFYRFYRDIPLVLPLHHQPPRQITSATMTANHRGVSCVVIQ